MHRSMLLQPLHLLGVLHKYNVRVVWRAHHAGLLKVGELHLAALAGRQNKEYQLQSLQPGNMSCLNQFFLHSSL